MNLPKDILLSSMSDYACFMRHHRTILTYNFFSIGTEMQCGKGGKGSKSKNKIDNFWFSESSIFTFHWMEFAQNKQIVQIKKWLRF